MKTQTKLEIVAFLLIASLLALGTSSGDEKPKPERKPKIVRAEAGPVRSEPSKPQNHILEVEVTGDVVWQAVLQTHPHDRIQIAAGGDSMISASFMIAQDSPEGALVQYALEFRVKVETTTPGGVRYDFEEQGVTGSVYLAKGEKTEVLRSIPLGLSFTLRQIGVSATKPSASEPAGAEAQNASAPRRRVLPRN
ncbi:MAG: hypothetical protein AAGA58_15525 [Verrucomicrobiota bacterium]